MKRFYIMAILSGLTAFGAAAQNDPAMIKMKIEAERVATVAAQARIVGVRSALIGSTVKNAPYSATELTESTQMLADGTRIHNETRTEVYRDSEGRLRRETPTEVTIWDPVANASYVLDPQKMTARKINVGTFVFSSGAGNRMVQFHGSVATTGSGSAEALEQMKLEAARKASELNTDVARRTAELEPAARKAAADRKTADVVVAAPQRMDVEYHTTVDPNGGAVRVGEFGETVAVGVSAGNVMMMRRSGTPPTTEALGKQVMEGVDVDGTRVTSTIATGEIGNDRPLKIVNERWYSSELQTLISSRQTDPRSGENSFKLINVNRAEPAAYLFQVPAAYQVLDNK